MAEITYKVDFSKMRGAMRAAMAVGLVETGLVAVGLGVVLLAADTESRWLGFYLFLFVSLLSLAVGAAGYLLFQRDPAYLMAVRLQFFVPAYYLTLVIAIVVISWIPALLETGTTTVIPGGGALIWTLSAHGGPFILLLVGVFALLCIAFILWELPRRSARLNFLTLDDAGLACGFWGKRWHWAWRDLSEFTLDERRRFNGLGFRGFAPAWGVAVSPIVKWRRIVLADVYDAPLTEIVAKLNEYRDRAAEAAPDAA